MTSSRPERRGRGRLFARLALGSGVAALSLAVTVDRTLGERTPQIASRWGSGAASVDAARASRLAQVGATPETLAKATRIATAALAREPGNVAALRTLGTIAALRDDLPRADRLFAYSEQLSRRDLATQLWLIEERVRHDDIPGVLLHYDRALRTKASARAVLFPVLVAAMNDPAVVRATVPLLARHVAWGPDFLAVMAQTTTASADALGQLVAAARLRPDVPAQASPLRAVLDRLTASGRIEAAYTAYARAVGAAAPTTIRDGGFEADPILPPFDWTFADEADLSATREARDGSTALVLRAANGSSGELARQLLLLRPGGYRLALFSSGAGGDRIARAIVSVTCQNGTALLQLPLSASSRAKLAGTFTVPTGCPSQMLTIAAPAGLGDADNEVVVDDLTITPARLYKVRTDLHRS